MKIHNVNYQTQRNDEQMKSIKHIFASCRYFNSTLNPLIYAYFNRDFREAFKSTLNCLFCAWWQRDALQLDLDNRRSSLRYDSRAKSVYSESYLKANNHQKGRRASDQLTESL